MMESDSEDDEAPSADGASEWARQVGESPEDDLAEMLSDLKSASVLATKMREEEVKGKATKKTAAQATEPASAAEPSTPKKGKRAAQSKSETEAPELVTPAKMQMSKTSVDVSDVSTPIRRVAYELAATGAALFTSSSQARDNDDGTAGSLFVSVKMIRSLNGLFIRINIESGHNLLAMDAGNTSDPYVKVSIINNATGAAVEGQVRRSGYRPKTLNPIWNESFYMGDENLSFKDYSLKFDVYDFDIMSSDDAMGQAVLPLSHFAKYANASIRKRKSIDTKREKKSLKQLEASKSLVSATSGTLSGEPSQIALKLSETKTGESKTEKTGERIAFKNGYFVLSHEWEMNVHLKLEKPSEETFLLQEAKAMLVFAKELIDPRNFGKGIASSSVGNWFNAKVEQAVDVGKRRALKVIDTTIEEKKTKVSALAVADRDMPVVIKQYLGGLINVYLSDIQSELMSSISMRMKITEGAKVAKDAEPESWKVKKRSPFSIKRMFNSMRCWYLYNEVPCDMTIFGKVRNPWWWVSLGTKVYFGLGLQAIVFFIRLVLVDKRDEWQMFEFIAVFKGIQFVSGTISVFSGAWSFIKCAGVIDAGSAHTCDTQGPWVDEMNTCAFSNPKVCAILNGVSYLVRILMCWFAFAKLKKSFAFGKAIAGDHRLIGGKILIVFVKPGSRRRSRIVEACCAKFSCRSKKPVEEEPLDRFRRIVRTQIDFIYASKGLRGGTERRAGLGKFHYVQRRAKVKDYDPATGLHTIYYKDDKERTLHDVDLSSMTYTVMKLKHLQPRRIQRFLWGYELLTFCATLAITLQFVEWIDWGGGAMWQVFLVTYWGQTLYNLLAFPFILMIIPGVNKLVCHAPKTGYDRQTGRLQRFRKRPTFAENVKEEPHPRSRIFRTCYPFSNKLRI